MITILILSKDLLKVMVNESWSPLDSFSKVVSDSVRKYISIFP